MPGKIIIQRKQQKRNKKHIKTKYKSYIDSSREKKDILWIYCGFPIELFTNKLDEFGKMSDQSTKDDSNIHEHVMAYIQETSARIQNLCSQQMLAIINESLTKSRTIEAESQQQQLLKEKARLQNLMVFIMRNNEMLKEENRKLQESLDQLAQQKVSSGKDSTMDGQVAESSGADK